MTSNITINNSASLSNGFFPIPIHSGVILQGLVGGAPTKWWQAGCPLISSDHKAEYEVDNPIFPIINLYLFSIQPGATIQNLRIRGASLDHKDFNDHRNLCGGIYAYGNGTSPINILNCEIFGFSQAGIWKNYDPDMMKIDNCYIHKVKGVSRYGIGYGAWFMSEKGPNVQEVNNTNTIFDDCKAAIDGQAHIVNWNIHNCTLSQFFQSEDINSHNDNRFEIEDCPCTGITPNYDNNYDYNPTLINSSLSFYGRYWEASVSCENNDCTPPATSTPGHAFGVLTSGFSSTYYPNLGGIPIHDVGGSVTSIQNSIFHKKWGLGVNGNINLSYPNLVNVMNGAPANNVNISFNTFATDNFDKDVVLNTKENNAGYAKIANNYIEADIWSIDGDHIKFDGNSFSYQSGTSVVSTAPQPHELSLELNDGTNSLPTSYSLSPFSGHKYIQYVDVNTSFTLEASITNAGGSAESYYIVRPNPNTNGVSSTSEAHVISNENYFFDSEEKLNGSTVTKSITYNKPGLYGIDVMGFDAHDYGSAEYDFRATSWQHIPVIVKGTQEQMLYFNIKDSYHKAGAALTGVRKQAYLNELLIWQEDISEGGAGWEYVAIDLTGNGLDVGTTPIFNVINTDGTENILSFSIFMEAGISTNEVAGVFVWVDDVYIPKTSSLNGDNLIKDGTMELSNNELCLSCHWFQNVTGAPTTLGCVTTDVGINSLDKKSGSNAIYLKVPYSKNCVYSNSQGQVVASVGTNIDFTDLLSCGDYSGLGFSAWTCSPCSSGTFSSNYIVNNDVSISGSVTISGSSMVIAADKKITVTSTGHLTITANSPLNSHLFACGNMWQGIVVEPGGQLTIGGYTVTGTGGSGRGTLIEGAKNAIDVDGGTVKVRFSEFNRNYLSMFLKNIPNTDSYIYGCKFRCEGGMIGKSPHMADKPYEHIILENTSNYIFPIGDPSNISGTGKTNYFSDSYHGINVYNSSVKIQRNNFSDIYKEEDGNLATDYGRAINIQNNGTATGLTITIGGVYSIANDQDELNTFTNVNLGINVDNITNCDLTIAGNTFNNPDYKVDPPPHAVLFYNHRTAIKVQNPIASPAIKAEIYGNTITDFRIGIHTLNIPDINIGTDVTGTLISGNTIEFDETTFPLTNFHEGIWLQNCAGAKVANNSVTNSTANEDLNFRGLDIETSADCFLNCNDIDDIGVAINIYDNCGTTKLRNNTMSHFFTGVWLNGPNGASIDVDQGDDTSQESWGNVWNWNAAPSLKVDGANFGGVSFVNWYHENADASSNPLSPRPWNANIVQPIYPKTNADDLCISFFRTTPNRQDNFGPVVGDSAIYTESEEKSRYLATQTSYIAMKNDSTLIYRGDSLDSDFESFFLRMDSSNVGKFHKVRELATNWPDSAKVINASIADTNDIEYNLKTFNALFFDKLIYGTAMNSTDSTFLDGLLTGSYITEGESFYNAAAAQSREIHPVSYSLRLGSTVLPDPIIVVPVPKQAIKIFPNPANSNLKVEILDADDKIILIELYSSLGNLIISKTCYSNLFELNIQSCQEGLYKLRAFTQKGFSDTKTFSIVR